MMFLAALMITPRIFFLSPSGDDQQDGLSVHSAWRSLARASREKLQPGDQLVLEEKATFRGEIKLTGGSSTGKPIVVRSSGKRATIVSPTGPAISANCGGIEIRDLILRGEAKAPREGHDGIRLAAPGEARQKGIRIERVDASEFGGTGLSLVGAKDSLAGFDDVTISHCIFRDNYGSGLTTEDGVAYLGKGYAHRNLVVTDCQFLRNHGGSGIIVSGFDGARIEYCLAADIDGASGGVGIWAWCARHVTFAHCIAHGTRTGGGDGGGFDLDGGCVDCTVSNCLAYDNDGPGYMHCDYPSSPRTERNVIRDSVSIDDGRKAKGDAVGFGFVTWGSGLYDCSIDHNIVVLDLADPERHENGLLFVTYIRSTDDDLQKQRIDGGVFRRNIVRLSKPGSAFVRNDLSDHAAGTIHFEENSFIGSGPFVDSGKGGARYESFGDWGEQPVNPNPALGVIGNFRELKPRDLPSFLIELFGSSRR